MPGNNDGDSAPEHKGHLPPLHLQGSIGIRTTCMNNLRASSELWNSCSGDNMKTVQMALSVV